MLQFQELTAAQGDIRVACHRTPDGDTLGAGLAVFLWMKGLGKSVGIVCADPVPGAYAVDCLNQFFRVRLVP